jgi:hypothetical protein
MKTLHWSIAQKHPAITFLLITFVLLSGPGRSGSQPYRFVAKTT